MKTMTKAYRLLNVTQNGKLRKKEECARLERFVLSAPRCCVDDASTCTALSKTSLCKNVLLCCYAEIKRTVPGQKEGSQHVTYFSFQLIIHFVMSFHDTCSVDRKPLC